MVPLVATMKCMRSETYEVLTYDILLEQAGFKSFKLFADLKTKSQQKPAPVGFLWRRSRRLS